MLMISTFSLILLYWNKSLIKFNMTVQTKIFLNMFEYECEHWICIWVTHTTFNMWHKWPGQQWDNCMVPAHRALAVPQSVVVRLQITHSIQIVFVSVKHFFSFVNLTSYTNISIKHLHHSWGCSIRGTCTTLKSATMSLGVPKPFPWEGQNENVKAKYNKIIHEIQILF